MLQTLEDDIKRCLCFSDYWYENVISVCLTDSFIFKECHAELSKALISMALIFMKPKAEILIIDLIQFYKHRDYEPVL